MFERCDSIKDIQRGIKSSKNHYDDKLQCFFHIRDCTRSLPLPLPCSHRYGDYHQKRHKLKQVLELVQQTSNPWAGDGSNGEEKSGGGKKKKKAGQVKGAFSWASWASWGESGREGKRAGGRNGARGGGISHRDWPRRGLEKQQLYSTQIKTHRPCIVITCSINHDLSVVRSINACCCCISFSRESTIIDKSNIVKYIALLFIW